MNPGHRVASSVRSLMRMESDENTIGVCDRWCRGIHMQDREKSRMLYHRRRSAPEGVIEDRLRESHRDLAESR